MKRVFILFITGILIVSLFESCKQSNATSGNNADEPEVSAPSERLETMGVLYVQTAGEYRALCYQAFNLAKFRLSFLIDQHRTTKPMAVIVDVDETVLDNSPFEAKGIINETHYPDGWDKWIKTSSAEAIPGAVEFTQFAQKNSVQVYYVTNREEKYRKETLNNLRALEFPFADDEHLFMKKEESSKMARRETISQRNEVLLFIGDDLSDFSEHFDKGSIEERSHLVDRFSDKFGSNFIVLPNPVYGGWVNAIYKNDKLLTPEQKATMRKEALKPF